MQRDSITMISLCLIIGVMASSEAFFLNWGSDSSRQTQQKWVQPMQPHPFGYQYAYSPYDGRKLYEIPNPHYGQPELQNMQIQPNLASIPISVPAAASLTPVSLQHVQLVPCMCPVSPEEAEKLQEQFGPGSYIAQTYAPQSYSIQQQLKVATDNSKSNKQ